MDLFTFRDSGGFYLDKGAIHDLGGEYLLFLNPLAIGRQSPQAARGATEVNYACGQSKPWRDVSAPERAELGSSPR